MTTIRTPERSPHAVSAFREVQPIAYLATDTVEFHPANMRLVYAALVDQVLHQPSHWVICECCHDSCVEPKAAFQPTRDVILAAAFPDAKFAGRVNSIVAGIEPQHHFTE